MDFSVFPRLRDVSVVKLKLFRLAFMLEKSGSWAILGKGRSRFLEAD